MDEDQFYFGELLNGKTGLVPSNYVERVPDHVLLQNASRAPSPVTGGGGGIRSSSLTNIACCEPSTSSVGCAGATNFNSSFRTATVSAGGTIQPGFIPFSEQLPSSSSSMHIPINNSERGGDGRNIWYQSSTLQRPESPSFALNVPFHHTQILHDFTDSQFAPLPDSVCPYPPVDVSKVTVQEMKQPDQPRGTSIYIC
uniref:SH3 domain-containing protein n=1 Tax=Panagrolaimus superbus TaxID=310955 RepID=A0A914YWY0_9BILA